MITDEGIPKRSPNKGFEPTQRARASIGPYLSQFPEWNRRAAYLLLLQQLACGKVRLARSRSANSRRYSTRSTQPTNHSNGKSKDNGTVGSTISGQHSKD